MSDDDIMLVEEGSADEEELKPKAKKDKKKAQKQAAEVDKSLLFEDEYDRRLRLLAEKEDKEEERRKNKEKRERTKLKKEEQQQAKRANVKEKKGSPKKKAKKQSNLDDDLEAELGLTKKELNDPKLLIAELDDEVTGKDLGKDITGSVSTVDHLRMVKDLENEVEEVFEKNSLSKERQKELAPLGFTRSPGGKSSTAKPLGFTRSPGGKSSPTYNPPTAKPSDLAHMSRDVYEEDEPKSKGKKQPKAKKGKKVVHVEDVVLQWWELIQFLQVQQSEFMKWFGKIEESIGKLGVESDEIEAMLSAQQVKPIIDDEGMEIELVEQSELPKEMVKLRALLAQEKQLSTAYMNVIDNFFEYLDILYKNSDQDPFDEFFPIGDLSSEYRTEATSEASTRKKQIKQKRQRYKVVFLALRNMIGFPYGKKGITRDKMIEILMNLAQTKNGYRKRYTNDALRAFSSSVQLFTLGYNSVNIYDDLLAFRELFQNELVITDEMLDSKAFAAWIQRVKKNYKEFVRQLLHPDLVQIWKRLIMANCIQPTVTFTHYPVDPRSVARKGPDFAQRANTSIAALLMWIDQIGMAYNTKHVVNRQPILNSEASLVIFSDFMDASYLKWRTDGTLEGYVKRAQHYQTEGTIKKYVTEGNWIEPKSITDQQMLKRAVRVFNNERDAEENSKDEFALKQIQEVSMNHYLNRLKVGLDVQRVKLLNGKEWNIPKGDFVRNGSFGVSHQLIERQTVAPSTREIQLSSLGTELSEEEEDELQALMETREGKKRVEFVPTEYTFYTKDISEAQDITHGSFVTIQVSSSPFTKATPQPGHAGHMVCLNLVENPNRGGYRIKMKLKNGKEVDVETPKSEVIWFKDSDKMKKGANSKKKDKETLPKYKGWYSKPIFINVVCENPKVTPEEFAYMYDKPEYLLNIWKAIVSILYKDGVYNSREYLWIADLDQMKKFGLVTEQLFIYVLRKYLDFAVCVTAEAVKDENLPLYKRVVDGEEYEFDYDLVITEESWIYTEVSETGVPINYLLKNDPYKVLLIRPTPSVEEAFVRLRYCYQNFFEKVFHCTFEESAFEIMSTDPKFSSASIKRAAEDPRSNRTSRPKFNGAPMEKNSQPYNQFEVDTTLIQDEWLPNKKSPPVEQKVVQGPRNTAPRLRAPPRKKDQQEEVVNLIVESVEEDEKDEIDTISVIPIKDRMNKDQQNKMTLPAYSLWDMLLNTEKQEFQDLIRQDNEDASQDDEEINKKRRDFLNRMYQRHWNRKKTKPEKARNQMTAEEVLSDHIPRLIPRVVLNSLTNKEDTLQALFRTTNSLRVESKNFLSQKGMLPSIVAAKKQLDRTLQKIKKQEKRKGIAENSQEYKKAVKLAQKEVRANFEITYSKKKGEVTDASTIDQMETLARKFVERRESAYQDLLRKITQSTEQEFEEGLIPNDETAQSELYSEDTVVRAIEEDMQTNNNDLESVILPPYVYADFGMEIPDDKRKDVFDRWTFEEE